MILVMAVFLDWLLEVWDLRRATAIGTIRDCDLTQSDVGRWVVSRNFDGQRQEGRIKGYNI